jgi:hypothetical protein
MRQSPDPALGLLPNILASKSRLAGARLRSQKMHAASIYSYQALGLLASSGSPPRNPLATLLKRKYGIPSWSKWSKFLGRDYKFAYGIIYQAESLYAANPSAWISHLDSFADLVTRKFQIVLQINSLTGAVPIVGGNGKNIDIGAILTNQTFINAFPNLVGKLSSIHKRRSQVPATHPYHKPSGKKTVP